MVQVASRVWSASHTKPSILVWQITRSPSFLALPPISQVAIPHAGPVSSVAHCSSSRPHASF